MTKLKLALCLLAFIPGSVFAMDDFANPVPGALVAFQLKQGGGFFLDDRIQALKCDRNRGLLFRTFACHASSRVRRARC